MSFRRQLSGSISDAKRVYANGSIGGNEIIGWGLKPTQDVVIEKNLVDPKNRNVFLSHLMVARSSHI